MMESLTGGLGLAGNDARERLHGIKEAQLGRQADTSALQCAYQSSRQT